MHAKCLAHLKKKTFFWKMDLYLTKYGTLKGGQFKKESSLTSTNTITLCICVL